MRENLTKAEIIERLESGLARMPRLRREIFLAVRCAGMSYAAIAERTGLSVEQVEQHLAAALLQLDDAVGRRVPWWQRLLRRFGDRRRR